MLEDEQSNKSTDLPEKSPRNQQDTESHPPDQLETIEHVTEGHGALRKARSFDSCPPCNLDEVDNPESSRRNTVPAKDLKKPSALSRGKNAGILRGNVRRGVVGCKRTFFNQGNVCILLEYIFFISLYPKSILVPTCRIFEPTS